MPGNNTKGLRFAPLIRVSTEAQEKRGESLAIQAEQVRRWVHELGGTVPKTIEKKYTAQEHATPEAERKILEHLLATVLYCGHCGYAQGVRLRVRGWR
jgi:hypothetical protein